MAQATTFGVERSGPVTPVVMFTRLDDNMDAAITQHSGSTIPSYAVAGTIWLDTTGVPWLLKMYDGVEDIVLLRINNSGNAAETFTGPVAVIASGTTTDLDATATNRYVQITGTTTITSFGSALPGLLRYVRFSGILTLTDGANLILPTGANITTAVGDSLIAYVDSTDVWRVIMYQRADGTALLGISLGNNNTFTKAQRGSITTLTDGATVTADLQDNNFFEVTLAGNRTLANPTNIASAIGQGGSIQITQDGTGSQTLAYGSLWHFAEGGAAPVLSTAPNAEDVLEYFVWSATRIDAALRSNIKPVV